jgi:kelch-like protein 10
MILVKIYKEIIKMFPVLLFLFAVIHKSLAWDGILLDGRNGTQLFIVENTTLIAIENVTNFDLPHLHGSVAVMMHGLAYFIGGQDANGQYHSVVTIFNPENNVTTLGTDMNYARYLHAATVVNHTIIVCGGSNGSLMNSCEKYNSETKNWTMIASLRTPIASVSMKTLNEKVYLFGGYIGGPACDGATVEVHMYDGTKWISRAPIPNCSADQASVAIGEDAALLCGGGNNNCYIYSANTDSWQSAKPMAHKRIGASMVIGNEGEHR